MIRKVIFAFLFFFSWVAVADPRSLKITDIQHVMERLFAFHIESKAMNPTLVRRSIKIYIDQFDPDKTYLLAKEITPWLQMSDRDVQAILGRLQSGDYSDFYALNELFQQAVFRAEASRAMLARDLLEEKSYDEPNSVPYSRYANSESELLQRQKGRMTRYFLYLQSRTSVDTTERKAKVFSLYERKMRRLESAILLQDPSGDNLSAEKAEHLVSVKILKAFAKSLDTHTTFFSPEEAYEMRLSLEKQFEGIGVILTEGIDGVMIAEIIKGSPAAMNGSIQENDLLVEIDGEDVTQIAFEDVLDALKKKEREVTLGLKNSAQFYRVTLRKQPIVMSEDRIQTSVERFGDGVIGKIALHSFYESGNGISSEQDLKEAIRSFRSVGELRGIVLDLRENSGGFLSQAVKVAGLFISNGVVVISKYGKGEIHYLRSIAGRPFFSGPVVVLTSKMSASAAEIVAQALQDYGVGLVVGDERTFGKGSIQYQTVTDERADLFFKITVGRYYTVSGRSTQITGVLADIVVPTQYAPFNIGERFLEYPLSPDAVNPAYVDPLTDLDERTQRVFEKRYIPFLQKVVPYWKKILPQLKKNSATRLSSSTEYQAFLRRMEKIRSRQAAQPVNSIDEPVRIGMDDLQMRESVNILQDMVEAQEGSEFFAPTGSDA